ncbi:calcium homeostasis modulator protein 6-like [Trichosurus vulpecula]|uniref:calcium homeostasis modulator protein 6-like n=1 Tax=Trichosurus vulpecula TaxID=9337 RepID=UPI00186B531D|nr:calcium homeostasis modulator protein 6-like [Trichosurus vulpecula]
MEKFKFVLNLLIKYHTVLGYSFVSLLTAGGESLFSSIVFQCPCSATWNLPYSLIFLLVPALILFLLGCLLSTRAKQLMTGCCAASRGEEELSEADSDLCVGMATCCHVTLAAAVAPITWIAMALLRGGFYECAASGSIWVSRLLCPDQEASCSEQLPKVPCQEAKPEQIQELLKELKAHSQVAGWTLIALVVLALLIFTSITRCRSPVNFLHLKFWKLYCQKEEEILMNEAKQHATELAEENVKCFFDGSQPKEFSLPNYKAWKKISLHHTFMPESQYYSILHKYVNKQEDDSNT